MADSTAQESTLRGVDTLTNFAGGLPQGLEYSVMVVLPMPRTH
jgi:hypothetical protein